MFLNISFDKFSISSQAFLSLGFISKTDLPLPTDLAYAIRSEREVFRSLKCSSPSSIATASLLSAVLSMRLKNAKVSNPAPRFFALSITASNLDKDQMSYALGKTGTTSLLQAIIAIRKASLSRPPQSITMSSQFLA